MRARVLLCCLSAIGWLALLQARASCAAAPTTAQTLAGLPLFFEPNYGQVEGAVGFLARAENCQFLVSPTRVQFVLWKRDGAALARSPEQRGVPSRAFRARAAQMEFVGANREATLRGTDELPGRINYLIGDDPRHWRTDLATFARVRVEQLYPGIGLVYYGNPHQLEYDFEVAPRGDPARISIRFDGIDDLAVDPEGHLVLNLGEDQLRHHRPAIYQVAAGRRHEISGGYRIKDKHTIGFDVGPYDQDLPLVIDPAFSYSTYFGGNSSDAAFSVKVDAAGSVYLAGATLSTSFLFAIPTNAFQTAFKGGNLTGDAFVAKLDATGSNLVYFTYLGGSKDEVAYDLALDSVGNVYLAGTTGSSDFPTTNALYPTISGVPDPILGVFPNDVFVAELNTNGSALLYSTYLGGGLDDIGWGVAIDPAGNTYVAGFTQSTNLPVVNALQSTNAGGDDAFVAKIGPGGTNLVYFTYLGGQGSDRAQSIAADENGYAYVTGYTLSTNFPYANGFQTTNSGGADVFVTRLNPGGSLSFSTYLGGTFSDFGTRIALDPLHNILVAGATISTNFPMANIPQGLRIGNDGTNAFNYDAFVARLGPGGNLLSAAVFGGTGDDPVWGLAVDALGRVFVAGPTLSANFPVTNTFGLFATNSAGGRDVFVTALDATMATAIYSGYLGGSSDEFAYGVAVDSESSAYVTGYTSSTNFPTASAFQPSLAGPNNAFLAKIRLFDPNLTASFTGGNLVLRWPVTARGYMLESALALNPPVSWTAVPQYPVLSQGFYYVTLGVSNAFSAFRLSK